MRRLQNSFLTLHRTHIIVQKTPNASQLHFLKMNKKKIYYKTSVLITLPMISWISIPIIPFTPYQPPVLILYMHSSWPLSVNIWIQLIPNNFVLISPPLLLQQQPLINNQCLLLHIQITSNNNLNNWNNKDNQPNICKECRGQCFTSVWNRCFGFN